MIFAGAVILAASFAWAEAVPSAARTADVVFLGEIHDNPHHHEVQADWVAALSPEALVFEMLTPEAARQATPELVADAEALEAALGWEASGWPSFALYYPIFAAAPEATVIGAAVPREGLGKILTGDLSKTFEHEQISNLGLDASLPEAQQSEREELQARAHCDALPGEMLPGMVMVQRVRDAALAQAALDALAGGAGQVVVITGNGHARMDWGAPAILQKAAPNLAIYTLGQAEDGDKPAGDFNRVLDAPAVDRPDPCAAFR
ncbi:MAG: ChaN family lipoprotein [Pseudomonadota bacterium]